jgi:carboxyl-terminal processing protease
MSKVDRGWAEDILKTVANDIRNHYYDPKLHGVNWDARVAKAYDEIEKAPSMSMALSYIAALVDSLHDSHTTFYPPPRASRYDYGWVDQMIGDRCYITHVRPGSDAEAKGIKAGDETLTINNYLPDRTSLWKMDYLFNVLRPQPSLRLLLQLAPTGSSRQVDVQAKVRQLKPASSLSWSAFRDMEAELHFLKAHSVELGDDLMILKFRNFYFTNTEVADMIGKARKHRTLILDLRENSGGSAETLKALVGALFDRNTKICDRVMRKETKEVIAKPQHHVFSGRLIVLVDSSSASASEVLARLVQIEKRGTVIGDHTAGLVMESRYYPNMSGGASITDADLIMTDGKSLEHVGVTPDDLVLPTAIDLANGRDPVMAHAAQLAGVQLTPEAAGRLFPYEWPPDLER